MASDAAVAFRPEELEGSLGDPFARVLTLGGRETRRFVLSLAVTLLLHAGAAARVYAMPADLSAFAIAIELRAAFLRTEAEIQIEQPPPEPKKPEPEPEAPPEPAPKTPPTEKPPPATPPAAAQAGKVLTADPDPDEPVDLTGNAFVQGDADSYAGGTTATTGTSKTAVYNPQAAASGTATAGPAPKGPPGKDLSRPAMPLSGSWEHCGFPAEADIEQVNYARVSLAVTVGADGSATNASVLADPGYGFGALAKRCALHERYQPARNKDGADIAFTQVITINFKR